MCLEIFFGEEQAATSKAAVLVGTSGTADKLGGKQAEAACEEFERQTEAVLGISLHSETAVGVTEFEAETAVMVRQCEAAVLLAEAAVEWDGLEEVLGLLGSLAGAAVWVETKALGEV